MFTVTWKAFLLIMFIDKLALLWLYMLIIYNMYCLEVEIEDEKTELKKLKKGARK